MKNGSLLPKQYRQSLVSDERINNCLTNKGFSVLLSTICSVNSGKINPSLSEISESINSHFSYIHIKTERVCETF